MKATALWRLLVGEPIATARQSHERLTKVKGLAVFSSDALSSSAYATEEVVRVLVLAGPAGLMLTAPVAFAIAALLAIVGTSYNQTIYAYPDGGGAYVVSKDNLGKGPSLLAGSSLLVDYVLTVAVSISAGTAAVTSAIPSLYPYRIALGVVFVAIITLINLRGVRESGTIFAIPTYIFLFSYAIMLAMGLAQLASGHVQPLPPHAQHVPPASIQALTVILVLRAFASGCAALTGIEAVSNGVPSFYKPEPRNASIVLVWMVSLLGVLFVGISVLAHHLRVVPVETETMVSQIARYVFGGGWPYFVVQFMTTLILILAANTAFADFPRLAALIAKDGFLPRQLANLGDRLVFNNGTIMLGALASLLIIVFKAETHSLIPLYMVGVFISFTLSQTGMVKHWLRVKGKRWQLQAAINGFGATATCVVGLVVAAVKFTEGAWMTLLVIGLVVWIMRSISQHYLAMAGQLSLEGMKPPAPFQRHRVIVPIASVHRGVLDAVRYARAMSDEVTGLYVELDARRTAKLKTDWQRWAPGVPLVVLPSPFRGVVGPILDYVDELQASSEPDTAITVVMPEFVPKQGWQHLLHNQTAWALRLAFLIRRDQERRVRVLSEVPFFLEH